MRFPDQKPSSRITIPVSCSDCLYFKNRGKFKVGGKKKTCSSLNRQPEQEVCVEYQPDCYQLTSVKKSNRVVYLAARVLLSFTKPSFVATLAAMVTHQQRLRKHGLKYGSHVSIELGNEVRKGFVMGAVDDRLLVSGKGFNASVEPSKISLLEEK